MKVSVHLNYVLIILLLFIKGSYAQTTYYLSNNGNDNNPGTRQLPFKSIEKLNQLIFKPGDEILFNGSQVYKGSLVIDENDSSIAGKPIYISSYGKGKAILKASKGNGILVKNLNGITIKNLIVTSNSLAENNGYGVKILNDNPGNGILNMVRISNIEVSNFRWAGIYVGGIPTDLPNVKAVDGCRFGFKNILIDKCTAHDNMYFGIYVSASWNTSSKDYGNEDVTIKDCFTFNNLGDPTYTANHSGSGILVDDTKKALVEYCISYNNGTLNAGATGGPCAIWSHSSDSVLIQYCEAFNNKTNGAADGGAFDFDGGVTNSIIQYCYSHENEGPGYLMWNYDGAPHRLGNNTVRYCISANDARKHSYGAIHIGTGGSPITNINIYNNTLIISENPFGKSKGIWIGGSTPNENLYLYNNIIVTDGKVPLLDIEPGSKNIIFSNNAYWCSGKSFFIHFEGSLFNNLSEWQQVKNNGRNDLFVNPVITQTKKIETIGNAHWLHRLKSYRLGANSLVIKKGKKQLNFNIPPSKNDLWGNGIPVYSNPDIGAFQY